MCDEFTRESIGGTVARSITADDVVDMLDAAVLVRGVLRFIRCDNGPEFIALAIRDWCRLNVGRVDAQVNSTQVIQFQA